MLVIVTSVVLRGVAVDSSLKGSPSHIFSFMRPGVFQAIGVISFAVRLILALVCDQAYGSLFVITIQCSSTSQSRRLRSTGQPAGFDPVLSAHNRFNAITHASTGMSLVCCLLMAVTGYVVFTDKTQGNILNNFSPDDLLINIARFCFGANMSTTSMSSVDFVFVS